MVLLGIFMGLSSQVVLADGTESLGTPSIAISEGTGIIANGTGLISQPGTIEITIPDNVTINQVLLYWEGQQIGSSTGDDQILVDGIPVNGTLIGGPTQFFSIGGSPVYSSSYRANVTGILSFATGSNTFSISGADFSYANNGAGILIIIDDGTLQTDIEIKDGNDLAYYGFAPPLHTTVPQTFTFAPSLSDRTADISMFFSSVSGTTSTEGFRPSSIKITYSTGGIEYIDNELDSNDGEEWDTLTRQITIPAEANEMTVQALSEDRLGIGGKNASFAWTAAALSVPVEIECNGSIGDLVWNDLNDDGIQDAGEPGIPGVTVNLYDESAILIATTTTDSNGFYLFEDLCINCYTVEVDESTLPDGMIQTPTMVGDDRSIDNNVNPSQVCLTIDNQENLTIDFGYVNESIEFSGCTPGYWKNHLDAWGPTGYAPADIFNEVFGVAYFGASFNLENALNSGGGGYNKVARHGTAALLNANHPSINYPLTSSEVIAAVQSGNVDDLVQYNELSDECPAQE